MVDAYQKDDPATIQQLFDSIATNYDRANAINSFQLYKYWNRSLVKAISSNGDDGPLLDLCCGTGDIAFCYAKRVRPSHKIHMLDFSSQMLNCARNKSNTLGIDCETFVYHHADAQKIPLPSASVSKATIAYGIRNVKDPVKCIVDVYRILKPNGYFGILELTQPENILLRIGHKAYLHTILPLIGKFVSSNREAYEYLCSSIQEFIKPKEIKNLLTQAGFQEVTISPLSCGIATLILAKK